MRNVLAIVLMLTAWLPARAWGSEEPAARGDRAAEVGLEAEFAPSEGSFALGLGAQTGDVLAWGEREISLQLAGEAALESSTTASRLELARRRVERLAEPVWRGAASLDARSPLAPELDLVASAASFGSGDGDALQLDTRLGLGLEWRVTGALALRADLAHAWAYAGSSAGSFVPRHDLELGLAARWSLTDALTLELASAHGAADLRLRVGAAYERGPLRLSLEWSGSPGRRAGAASSGGASRILRCPGCTAAQAEAVAVGEAAALRAAVELVF